MSLHDIIMQRASIHFDNEFNAQRTAQEGLMALANTATDFIVKQREEAKAKKLREEEFDQQLQLGEAKLTNAKKLAEFKAGQKITSTKIESSLLKDARKAGISVSGKTSEQVQEELTIKNKATQGTELSSLTPEQQVQAVDLAKKRFGVRGIKTGLPSVIALMKENKTVDEIEDILRFGGQSPEFSGAVRDAAQSVFINTSGKVADRAFDFIDDELSKGNIKGVQDKLKKSARDTSGAEVKKSIGGKERTVEFLDEIQSDLNRLEASGVNTNIFSGTVEDVNKKVGRVNNPELRKVATKIKVAIINYRRSVSGAAFSEPESKEYRDIFPGIGRTSDFNRATIEALRETMSGDLDNFYSLSMGSDNYNKLFKSDAETNTFNTVAEAESANLPVGTEIIINGRRAVIE